MATTTTIQAVKGTRDFYPEAMAFRNWLHDRVRAVSEQFGYQEYEAPILERLELYAAKSGEELVKEQAFVLTDRGGDELALRPELTPSLARMVAQRQGRLTLPVRWFSFGPFWRYERPQRGRSREFFQWNIDLLGVESATADGEIVSIAALFLRSLGLTPDDVAIHYNSRRLMEQKLAEIGLGEGKEGEVFRLVDRRDKLPADKWQEWALDMGLTGEQFDALVGVLDDRDLWRESEELCQVVSTAEALGVAGYLIYDAGIVRGLDYYTGPVFEARDRVKFFRAILGGGRYDNLVADVGGERLTGTGFAMGDVIVELLLERAGKSPHLPASPSQVLVTLFDEELYLATIGLASRIREAGIRAEQVLDPDRLGKQIRYADRKGIPFVVILGPDELKAGQVVLKDLATGEQETHTEESLIRRLLAV
ncbi:MAG: histidine--tRNA ligase [Anaerolineae bacterium]|jgi:histidyl-tRNA synthetase|nr:histidine--tRNA ligase [Anaerolineae bacterium]MDX9832100.1 histidine--tRNA ligase [Anaerolineae bacterium]